MAAFAVHFLVVDLAAQDRVGYGRQYMRFAFAQPEFRTYLAGKAAWKRHIAISRVLTRASHSGTSATAPNALPRSSNRVAGDDVVKPASRAPPARSVNAEEAFSGGGTGPGQQKLPHAVVAVSLEQSEGGLRSTSSLASEPGVVDVSPATKVGAALSQTVVRPRVETPSSRRYRDRKPRAKEQPKPVVAGPKFVSKLPDWARTALFNSDG